MIFLLVQSLGAQGFLVKVSLQLITYLIVQIVYLISKYVDQQTIIKMNNLVKKHRTSKIQDQLNRTYKSQYQRGHSGLTSTKDEEEDQMISQQSKFQTYIKSSQILNHQNYYHIFNPNLNREDFSSNNSRIFNCKQLSLKSLILFLMLLSFLMAAAYKIIEEIYQIQHPQNLITKKVSGNRLSMEKQSSIKVKQLNKAQQKIGGGLQEEASKKIQATLNRLQLTQKRFKETIEDNNFKKSSQLSKGLYFDKVQKRLQKSDIDLRNKDKTERLSSEQQKLGSEIDSVQREKEQDIEALQNDKQQNTRQNPQIQQAASLAQNNQQGNTERVQVGNMANTRYKNPVIPNSNSYVWNNYGSGPISKANITKQNAIRWKSYVKMIELPVGMSNKDDPMLEEEYNYYEEKYRISQYSELPICVVIPSYNNAQNSRYKVNLQSILQQNYSNYHIVFIDDMSEDRTGYLVQEYLSSFEPKYRQKVKVIINKERKMAMPNLRYAANSECKQNQLFIIVDGDDSLIGRQVFKLFSAVMQEKNLWVMWTNFLSPKGSIGYSRQYPLPARQSNNYRKAGFVMSHLRAYYTKLFRLIKEEDLKDENGQYLHAANDVAIGIPILEMAHLHTSYVPEISYFYNMNTGLNNHRVRLKQQKTNDRKIRKRPKYEALSSLNFNQMDSALRQNYQQNIAPQKQLRIDQMQYDLHGRASRR